MRPALQRLAPAAAVLGLGLAGLAGAEAVRARREAERLREALHARVAVEETRPRPAPAPAAPGALATGAHLRRLRAAGLEDPLADLRADLQAHPELIPIEATLGGRMGFYAPEGIVLLADRWVYAYFEDGHRAGSMLLEFEVLPGGRIAWTPLAATAW